MANLVVSAIDAMRLMLRDTNTDTAKQTLLDADYERFLMGSIGTEQTFVFNKLRTGIWVLQGSPCAIYGPYGTSAANMGFTQQGGAEYTLTCAVPDPLYGVPSIKLTSGTDTSTTLTVTACLLNFARAAEAMLVFAANHRAIAYSQSFSGNTISPETARRELLAQAEVWRGTRAL